MITLAIEELEAVTGGYHDPVPSAPEKGMTHITPPCQAQIVPIPNVTSSPTYIPVGDKQ